jgi:hypothetical protein
MAIASERPYASDTVAFGWCMNGKQDDALWLLLRLSGSPIQAQNPGVHGMYT